MGEAPAHLNFSSEKVLLQYSDADFKSPLSPLSPLFIHIQSPPNNPSPSSDDDEHISVNINLNDQNLKDSWLPLTESRNGNSYYAAFHILNSNIGFQALMLPLAFPTLGWAWGSVCLSVVFVWQLYTIVLLLLLHESVPGIRYSRFLFLAMAAFGKKIGKVAALFPVMYLSGGTCVMFIITGGGTMQQFYHTVCPKDTCHGHALSDAEWFLVFTCIAILIAQLPNLNSIAGVSLVGAIAGVSYCTLFWVLSVKKGRPAQVSYSPSLAQDGDSAVAKIAAVMNAVGTVVFAFRGHNVLLEIQGTLPSSTERPSKKSMLKGVTIAYMIIAMCVFPLAVAGFWAYGNQIRGSGGLLTAFPKFHRHQVTKFTMGFIYLLIITNCLTSFQVYAMPIFDNLELRYTSLKKKKCSRLVRTCLRLFFGGLAFFIAVAFPFLPALASLLGGFTLVPLTYAYPCFMWVAIKKPTRGGSQWWFNMALGCLGLVLSVLLVAAAIWTLAHNGLHANFFKP